MDITREPLAEVEEMRASLLAVRDDRGAMQRVIMLAERAANIVKEIGKKITEADRQSLLWHLSLIRELAVVSGARSRQRTRCPNLIHRMTPRSRGELDRV
jgi:hypothetical protein